MYAEANGFTPREQQVLELAAAGHTNSEIGRQLGITRNAVRFHLKELHTKLHTDGDRDLLRRHATPAGSGNRGGSRDGQDGPMCSLRIRRPGVHMRRTHRRVAIMAGLRR